MVGKVTKIRTQSPTPGIKRQLSMKKLGSSYIRKELTTKYSPSHIRNLAVHVPHPIQYKHEQENIRYSPHFAPLSLYILLPTGQKPSCYLSITLSGSKSLSEPSCLLCTEGTGVVRRECRLVGTITSSAPGSSATKNLSTSSLLNTGCR